MENLLNISLVLFVVFSIYELLKIVFIRKYWKMCITKRSALILTIDSIYTIFMVVLLFTKYWYVGLGVLLISFVTVFGISQALKQKIDYNSSINNYMLIDGILTIIILLLPILSKLT